HVLRLLYFVSLLLTRRPPRPTLFPYTTLFRSEGSEVEVAAAVQHFRLGAGVLEVEELELGGDVERVAEGGRLVEVAFEDLAGVAEERFPVGGVDATEHPGDVLFLAPRQDGEGRGVGASQHVRLLHPGVPVDGRPVEGHPLLEGHFELGRADRDRLQKALDVGEPEADEADAPFFDGAEDVLGLFGHVITRWGSGQHYAASGPAPSLRDVSTPTAVPASDTPTATRMPVGRVVASVMAATAAGPAMNPIRLPSVRAASPLPSAKPRWEPARRYRSGNTTATPRPQRASAASATGCDSVVTRPTRPKATRARLP